MTDSTSPTEAELDPVGLRAELAALHEGEEPYEDERLVPTPGQWIWRWNHGTPEQRLLWAALVVQALSEAHTCKVLAFHEQRINELKQALDGSFLHHKNVELHQGIEQTEAERDGAYRERAQLTAWLAAIYPAVLAPAPDVDEDGWQILYLAVDGQQLSWHIHPGDAELFGHVERVPVDDPRALWDGHTTVEKYERIRTLASTPQGRTSDDRS